MSDRTIRRLVDDGAGSIREIARACRAGTVCGTCIPVLQQLLEEARPAGDAGSAPVA